MTSRKVFEIIIFSTYGQKYFQHMAAQKLPDTKMNLGGKIHIKVKRFFLNQTIYLDFCHHIYIDVKDFIKRRSCQTQYILICKFAGWVQNLLETFQRTKGLLFQLSCHAQIFKHKIDNYGNFLLYKCYFALCAKVIPYKLYHLSHNAKESMFFQNS